ncbi:hypothetical protein D9758_014239 [Tetrapyrgos nigripes]|uniref:Uncharacterized protein n=1 Tax=Tetrapyrgos nigripes TaxID=182062 RepID=A0A8H5CBH9_9AGAR|nr:hypothetical protein D9758_014239 [Tetrapyrgos nigripes]
MVFLTSRFAVLAVSLSLALLSVSPAPVDAVAIEPRRQHTTAEQTTIPLPPKAKLAKASTSKASNKKVSVKLPGASVHLSKGEKKKGKSRAKKEGDVEERGLWVGLGGVDHLLQSYFHVRRDHHAKVIVNGDRNHLKLDHYVDEHGHHKVVVNGDRNHLRLEHRDEATMSDVEPRHEDKVVLNGDREHVTVDCDDPHLKVIVNRRHDHIRCRRSPEQEDTADSHELHVCSQRYYRHPRDVQERTTASEGFVGVFSDSKQIGALCKSSTSEEFDVCEHPSDGTLLELMRDHSMPQTDPSSVVVRIVVHSGNDESSPSCVTFSEDSSSSPQSLKASPCLPGEIARTQNSSQFFDFKPDDNTIDPMSYKTSDDDDLVQPQSVDNTPVGSEMLASRSPTTEPVTLKWMPAAANMTMQDVGPSSNSTVTETVTTTMTATSTSTSASSPSTTALKVEVYADDSSSDVVTTTSSTDPSATMTSSPTDSSSSSTESVTTPTSSATESLDADAVASSIASSSSAPSTTDSSSSTDSAASASTASDASVTLARRSTAPYAWKFMAL